MGRRTPGPRPALLWSRREFIPVGGVFIPISALPEGGRGTAATLTSQLLCLAAASAPPSAAWS